MDYIIKLKENPLARKVKLMDLHDKIDPRRIPEMLGFQMSSLFILFYLLFYLCFSVSLFYRKK
jgi:hypothetical protein